MDACVKDNGELAYPSYFVDWPTSGTPDEIHGVRAINVIMAKNAVEILRHFGKDASVAEGMLNKLLKIKKFKCKHNCYLLIVFYKEACLFRESITSIKYSF